MIDLSALDDERILSQAVAELAKMQKITLPIEAIEVVSLVGLLQLAMRHPDIDENTESIARKFIFHIQLVMQLHQASATLELIERGFDLSHDA